MWPWQSNCVPQFLHPRRVSVGADEFKNLLFSVIGLFDSNLKYVGKPINKVTNQPIKQAKSLIVEDKKNIVLILQRDWKRLLEFQKDNVIARSGTKVILSSTLNMSRKSAFGDQDNRKDGTKMFRLELTWGLCLTKRDWRENDGSRRDWECNSRKIWEYLC